MHRQALVAGMLTTSHAARRMEFDGEEVMGCRRAVICWPDRMPRQQLSITLPDMWVELIAALATRNSYP
jgi:hypothetical protein